MKCNYLEGATCKGCCVAAQEHQDCVKCGDRFLYCDHCRKPQDEQGE